MGAKRATATASSESANGKDRRKLAASLAENGEADPTGMADDMEVDSKPAETEKLDSIELNFGSDSNLIHPLLIPSSKLRNAMKRRQDKLALSHEGESRMKRSKH